MHLLITDQITQQKPAKSLINISNVHLLTDQTTRQKPAKSLINISNVHLLTDQTTQQKPAKSLINISNVHLLTDQTTRQKPAKSGKMKEHRHRTEKLVKCKIKLGLSVLYTFGISTKDEELDLPTLYWLAKLH